MVIPPGELRVRIGPSGPKGRGVFAIGPIARGELIEVAPVLVIPAEHWCHIEPTVLQFYIYNFGPVGEHAAVALGFGSLYNHSFSPNAEYHKSWDERLIRFMALRDIASGQEVTINYNGSPGDQTPMVFEVIA